MGTLNYDQVGERDTPGSSTSFGVLMGLLLAGLPQVLDSTLQARHIGADSLHKP